MATAVERGTRVDDLTDDSRSVWRDVERRWFEVELGSELDLLLNLSRLGSGGASYRAAHWGKDLNRSAAGRSSIRRCAAVKSSATMETFRPHLESNPGTDSSKPLYPSYPETPTLRS
jgi:hypothetical protein